MVKYRVSQEITYTNLRQRLDPYLIATLTNNSEATGWKGFGSVQRGSLQSEQSDSLFPSVLAEVLLVILGVSNQLWIELYYVTQFPALTLK